MWLHLRTVHFQFNPKRTNLKLVWSAEKEKVRMIDAGNLKHLTWAKVNDGAITQWLNPSSPHPTPTHQKKNITLVGTNTAHKRHFGSSPHVENQWTNPRTYVYLNCFKFYTLSSLIYKLQCYTSIEFHMTMIRLI